MDGGGYSPRFQRQASCSCAPSISRRGFVRAGFDLDGDDDYYDDDVAFHSSSSSSSSKVGGPGAPYYSAGTPRPSARARLRALWRRIMREKKRILLCSTGCVPAHAPAPHPTTPTATRRTSTTARRGWSPTTSRDPSPRASSSPPGCSRGSPCSDRRPPAARFFF
ncbi:unnamed protein product [Miscanthus lutarioriparius]|uniref:Uncharacterized protein n=1 Tax=Miscanthus lutarioriparius TaxID=422564 RepID=A0A811NY58_9POAL|nr:unnamed protein product [Miscanthus lutarioriparius]